MFLTSSEKYTFLSSSSGEGAGGATALTFVNFVPREIIGRSPAKGQSWGV